MMTLLLLLAFWDGLQWWPPCDSRVTFHDRRHRTRADVIGTVGTSILLLPSTGPSLPHVAGGLRAGPWAGSEGPACWMCISPSFVVVMVCVCPM
uniref:Secreted peptide n=1 Tax=Anopheles braziliensis TaxID=58242 RepID=A0A2M3ZM27_9DIPT